MTKVIVTHFKPDLDALTSIWLIKRFLNGWGEAEVQFVSAGETLSGAIPDSDPDVIHVDTGLGKFDHHQGKSQNSAAKLCLTEILLRESVKKLEEKALRRMVEVVTEVDNGRDISWPEADSDRYEFMLHSLLENSYDDEDLLDFGLRALDRIFYVLKNKVKAEGILREEGVVFKTKWGKAIGVETGNDQVLQIGQKQGYVLVAKKNGNTGFLRIYARWDKKVDLTTAWEEFQKADPEATWYLHPSKCLLLNGSSANPKMIPTKLSLKEVIQALRKV